MLFFQCAGSFCRYNVNVWQDWIFIGDTSVFMTVVMWTVGSTNNFGRKLKEKPEIFSAEVLRVIS